jgi:hypothetical protein
MDDKTFISYARIDRPFAEELATKLRAAGIEVWLDKQIRIGEKWARKIQKALKQSATVIVILTPEAADSDFVRNEIFYAQDMSKRVLPIVRRLCDIPLELRQLQRKDFTSDDYTEALDDLIEDIKSPPASDSSAEFSADSAGATHQKAGTTVLRPEPSPQRVMGAIYGAIGGSLFGAMTQWLLYNADPRRDLGGGGFYIAVVAIGTLSAGLLWVIAGAIAALRPKSLVWAAAAAAVVAALWIVIFGTKVDVVSAAFVFGSPLAAVIAVVVQRYKVKTPAARAA